MNLRFIRAGASCIFLVWLLISAGAEAAWFKTPEQVAADKFTQGDYSDAADSFSDTYRRGVALYRAGRFTDAGEAFAKVERKEVKADALYNLGNTRFKRSDYTGAIEAYEESLTLRPKDEDTLHNLALARKIVDESGIETPEEEEEEQPEEEQPEEEQQEEEQQEEEQQEEEQQQEEESESEEQEESEQQQESEQEQESEEQEESEEQSGEQEQESEEQSGEQE
ncbi:MAG: tetratricopeptide repeat protein, partial [Gammaproteobacteria bacterium]